MGLAELAGPGARFELGGQRLLVAETTGETDTYIEFFDGESRRLLTENDDGSSNYNARIRYEVTAGHRYLVKVRGYSSSTYGEFGFRAYLSVPVTFDPDEYEPNDEASQAKLIEIGIPQVHSFHSADDIDWVKIIISESGYYTIRTGGVNSNRLDTYIELFNENLNSIASDDDGGEYLDSCLSLLLERGVYYLKVECFDDEPDQLYSISIEAE